MSDRARLLQGSLYAVTQLLYSQQYRLSEREYNYLNFSARERDAIFCAFPHLSPLGAQFHSLGGLLRPLELDAIELALLAVLLVLDPGVYNTVRLL